MGQADVKSLSRVSDGSADCRQLCRNENYVYVLH